MTRVALITVAPRNPATAATTTLRLAGGGNLKPYDYGGNKYRAGLAALPRFKAELGFDETGWTGWTQPSAGDIPWMPSTKADLSAFAAYYWPKAAITVQEGDEATGAFTTRLAGKVADAPIKDHQLVISVADLAADLAKPLVTARFFGTGGVEGGAEAKGRAKRRTFGRAFNIEARVLLKADNVYELGDLNFPWQSIDVIRDIGRDEAPPHTTIAWQGSVAATLEALRTSTPAAQGTGVAAPSIACIKWWTQPAGPLTADVHGEVGAGYVETAPSIAERILAAVAGPAVTNTAAANALRAYACGIHVDEDESVASALDRLLLPVSLLWPLDPAGTVTLREISFAAPVETLRSDNPERVRTLPPVKTRRVGYQRAYRTHSDGELATILTEAGASFVQATPPAALDSAPGAHWLDSDDNNHSYIRVAGSGFVQLAGGAVILNGAPVELAWTDAPGGPDNTAANQVTLQPPAAPTIQRNNAGTVITGQLPRTVARPGVTRNGASIAANDNVGYAIQNILGGLGAVTIDNTRGSATKGQSTIPSAGFTGSGSFEILVTVDGLALQPMKILVTAQNADPTTGGSGSKAGTTAIGDVVSGTSFVQVGALMTVTKAAGETMRGTLGASYLYSGPSTGSRYALVKWQYSPTGAGTWTDFSSAVSGTNATFDAGTFDQSPGSITCNQNAAPANATYDVRLVAAVSATGGSLSFDGSNAFMNVGV